MHLQTGLRWESLGLYSAARTSWLDFGEEWEEEMDWATEGKGTDGQGKEGVENEKGGGIELRGAVFAPLVLGG